MFPPPGSGVPSGPACIPSFPSGASGIVSVPVPSFGAPPVFHTFSFGGVQMHSLHLGHLHDLHLAYRLHHLLPVRPAPNPTTPAVQLASPDQTAL